MFRTRALNVFARVSGLVRRRYCGRAMEIGNGLVPGKVIDRGGDCDAGTESVCESTEARCSQTLDRKTPF